MPRLWKSATVLLLAIFGLSGLTPVATAQKGGARKPVKKKQQEQPATPPLPAYTPAPLQPLPLDQTPAVAPKVDFTDGQLTIVAHNCVLADVLKAVRKQTGAEFDIPSNATERVVADIGPGPARDVLAELLNGTHFNYVLVGSLSDPTAVESILLTPKTVGPDAPSPSISAAGPGGPPQRGFAQRTLPPVANGPQTDVAAQGMDDADANDDSDQTDAQDEQQLNPPNPPTGTPDQQTPKTPEQLLQELQRQQQQQQQPPSNQPPQGLIPNQPPTQAPRDKPE